EVTFTTMFPVPNGNYVNVQAKQVKLKPQITAPTCNPGSGTGSLYSTDLGEIRVCKSAGWVPLNIWTISGSIAYPSGSSTDPNFKVGIGTSTPTAKLHLTQDGSIIAQGVFNNG